MNVRGQLHSKATLSPAKTTSNNLATESVLTRCKKGKNFVPTWNIYQIIRSVGRSVLRLVTVLIKLRQAIPDTRAGVLSF
jgi:hypothetical protein